MKSITTALSVSIDQARRIALSAHGLASGRLGGHSGSDHLGHVLDHIGLIQIDSVNVLVRSQELPLFSSLVVIKSVTVTVAD